MCFICVTGEYMRDGDNVSANPENAYFLLLIRQYITLFLWFSVDNLSFCYSAFISESRFQVCFGVDGVI